MKWNRNFVATVELGVVLSLLRAGALRLGRVYAASGRVRGFGIAVIVTRIVRGNPT